MNTRIFHMVTLMTGVACTSPTPEPTVDKRGTNEAPDQPERNEDGPNCPGFPDAQIGLAPSEASTAAAASNALTCLGLLPGYYERCPSLDNPTTGEAMCPALARGIAYPGQRVLCGACLATRAQMLTYGIQAFARPNTVAEVRGCAMDGRCEGWRLCSESLSGELDENDWVTSFIGWAIAPERAFFRGDGSPEATEHRTCRPHSPALYIEAATYFARLSAMDPADARANITEVADAYADALSRAEHFCGYAGVAADGQWWIPATVVMNNLGIMCMSTNADGLRTANICGTEALAECHLTHAQLAIMSARLHGLIPRAECVPIKPVCSYRNHRL